MGSLAAQLYSYVVEVWRGVVWWEGGWEWGMLSMFQKCEWMGESESGFLDCYSFGILKKIRVI